MLKYESIAELVSEAEKQGIRISEMVMKDQAEAMETTELETFEKMELDFQVMVNSVHAGLQKDQRALAVAGCNASMGRIVAAPTAGSCGILPGCLVSLLEERGIPEKEIVMSMFTAGAFGIVIARKASIAGAQGGCQAECGSAAAMAAAALTELMGGTPSQCADACAIAIANQLGLVCDPVAGLVEIPCIKRNVSGLVIAFSSADLALAGIEAKIPADECLDAMRSVGDTMPEALKETAKGGLAATPTGIRIQKQVFGESE